MNLSETMRRIPLIVEQLLAASFVILLVRVLYFVLGNSAIEWPFEYREFASISFTGALLDGINPYAIEHEPYFTNVYGPLYRPLGLALGGTRGKRIPGAPPGLAVFHRRRIRAALLPDPPRPGRRALALCAGVVFFLAQTDDVAGLARPDGLGMFLFLGALAVLVRSPSAGPITLASGALLVVLAFFTEPYFILAAPIGAAFLLLRRRPAALLRYASWGLG